MRRFSDAEVAPHAHRWHLENAYIPLDLITQMSEIGVFGLTIPEEFGGVLPERSTVGGPVLEPLDSRTSRTLTAKNQRWQPSHEAVYTTHHPSRL